MKIKMVLCLRASCALKFALMVLQYFVVLKSFIFLHRPIIDYLPKLYVLEHSQINIKSNFNCLKEQKLNPYVSVSS